MSKAFELLYLGYARKSSFAKDPRFGKLKEELVTINGQSLAWSRAWEYPWAALECLEEPLDKNLTLALDAGGGYACFQKWLSQRVKEVHNADCDPSITSCASFAPNIFPCQTDIKNLPYQDNTFDLTLCISVLEHIPNWPPEKTWFELLRVTKPGGRLIITTDVNMVNNSPYNFKIHEMENFLKNTVGEVLDTDCLIKHPDPDIWRSKELNEIIDFTVLAMSVRKLNTEKELNHV